MILKSDANLLRLSAYIFLLENTINTEKKQTFTYMWQMCYHCAAVGIQGCWLLNELTSIFTVILHNASRIFGHKTKNKWSRDKLIATSWSWIAICLFFIFKWAILTMTSFYYYDQNPSAFCFFANDGFIACVKTPPMTAFVILTSLGLANLNTNGKTKRILVVIQ